MFDLKTFLLMSAALAPFVLPLVMALVTYWGKLGVAGTWQFVSSLATGLVLGGAVWYFSYPPLSGAGWFSLVLFGLIMGLAASGVYEVGKELAKK
jgi:hypothetical protein